MSEVKIYTNYHKRDLLYLWELSEKRQQEAQDRYDYATQGELESMQWFVYKGALYSLDDFMDLSSLSSINFYVLF